MQQRTVSYLMRFWKKHRFQEQQVELYIRESRMHSTKELLDKVEALELQQKNTKIAMEQMQAQIAALQAKLNGEDAR